MNTSTITTWIAQHRLRTALIALGFIAMTWDWFAIPRLIIAMILPFALLAAPLILFGAPIFFLVRSLRKRAQSRVPEDHSINPHIHQEYPEALPQRTSRPLTEQEFIDVYERYPERFDGVDFGDDVNH